MIIPGLRKELESAVGSTKNVELGRALVRNGEFEFKGFPATKADLPVDWTSNPLNNRTWLWQTTSFNFFPWLMACHAMDGDKRAIDLALRCVEAWLAQLPALEKKGFEFAWHDHATALRTQHVLWLLKYLEARRLRPKKLALLKRFLVKMSERLFEEGFYSRHTNHGIEQARVLALVAISLPQLQDASKWRAVALTRLRSELEFAFAADGVHVENSPAYHVFVTRLFCRIYSYFSSQELGDLGRAIEVAMPLAMHYLTHVTRPDGLLPPIGDTEMTSVTNPFMGFEGAEHYQCVQFSLSAGKLGSVPTETHSLFTASGWYIERDTWKATRHYLVFKAGYLSEYHRHDDDLSIYLWAFGEDWLVDGGLLHYKENEAQRIYLRSRLAHNLPILLGDDGYRSLFDRQRHRTARITHQASNQTMSRVTGIAEVRPGYWLRRQIETRRDPFQLIVTDVATRADPTVPVMRLCTLWHFPADKTVRLKGNSVEVGSKSCRLVLTPANGYQAAPRYVDAAALDGITPIMSPKINETSPTHIISFESQEEQLTSSIELTFWPNT
ncbi:heparinase II/III family protein [Reyranella soli]|uniref:Uncharacterized protein n=1 Tax=Reyranella soli TaxID=1230389 RepID=A0A512NR57_9HYPH|nr:heparinase II/III family protein [Reyranella soli]GEP61436.1 hypothetical protein RSO01_86020 [Reyranella soli]